MLNDFRCVDCDHILRDVFYLSQHERQTLRCDRCNGALSWVPNGSYVHEWGGPRYIASLDMEFDSRGSFYKYLRKEGLGPSPSADKHHGARNESHLHLGKVYSYKGK